MEKPDWLKCEKCLFKTTDLFANCLHGPNRIDTKNNNFCSNWTCSTCWQTWDDYFFKEENHHITDMAVYVDHNKCKPVKFGVR